LSLLANRAKETLITLTGDIEHPQRAAHHRFHRAQQAIISSLNIQPEAMNSSSMLSADIANVEANLFERSNDFGRSQATEVATTPATTIEFIEAQTRAVEARAALRWVKARVVRDGMKLSDVAILVRDSEPYRPFL
jgi:ATP-dependent helicase/DNAse subunit B